MLALATIRRILMDLGHALQPEAPGTLVGPLELWMHHYNFARPHSATSYRHPASCLEFDRNNVVRNNSLRAG